MSNNAVSGTDAESLPTCPMRSAVRAKSSKARTGNACVASYEVLAAKVASEVGVRR